LLNLDSHEVTVDGQSVHLTGKEYAILELLVLRKGMVLTKEAFLNPTASLNLLDRPLTLLSATRASRQCLRQSPREADTQRGD